ncbi:hypothetical protein CRE_30180 [Caenorhabditis remanei]|uniref:Glycosyltransferase 2-like domain-containing protein n=1 Tax=Caenorhabditis remanei TaxID=31234 RepID=E3NE16_CAERE|nr:hypothetical protein CRE_30180 [Caenorhabditis remanei]
MYEFDVSVIIPARNAEKFLRETLNGLLAQTAVENARIEICLADDGSVDDTVRILENSRLEFEELGMKVVVSHVSQPGGVGAAKDCAVRSSRGRYLCFNDADDVSTPDRIRCQLEMARRLSKSSDDLVFVGGQFHRFPENSTSRYTKWANSIKGEQIKRTTRQSVGKYSFTTYSFTTDSSFTTLLIYYHHSFTTTYSFTTDSSFTTFTHLLPYYSFTTVCSFTTFTHLLPFAHLLPTMLRNPARIFSQSAFIFILSVFFSFKIKFCYNFRNKFLRNMTKKWKTPSELEELMNANKFDTVDEVGMTELARLKSDGELFVKLIASKCGKMPYDPHIWSKTGRLGGDVKVRHQPKYVKVNVHGTAVTSIRCTAVDNEYLKKQIFPYENHVYVYYFLIEDPEDYDVPTASSTRKRRLEGIDGLFFKSRKNAKISAHVSKVLKEDIIPFRNLDGARRVALEKGLTVTTKQVCLGIRNFTNNHYFQIQNLTRSQNTAIVGRSGPKSKSTIRTIERIELEYPGQTVYSIDNSNLLQFSAWHSFPTAIAMYLKSCPKKEKLVKWQEEVERIVKLNREERREAVNSILKKHKGGLVFPSRLHCDTTFNLSDVYVTFLLGECNKFRTKTSGKPRVLPLGFMMHSDKKSETHREFAKFLARSFSGDGDVSIPCMLADGETTLEEYSEVGNKWMTGLLGALDECELDRRLRCMDGKIEKRVYDWLLKNKTMLMKSASAAAKLRAGHVLQYSTNNSCETFNKIVKTQLNKRLPADQLMNQLIRICEEKIEDCWISALNGSDTVVLKEFPSTQFSLIERKLFFCDLGLYAPTLLALDVPLRMVKDFNMNRCSKEDKETEFLELIYSSEDVFGLKYIEFEETPSFHQVIRSDGILRCSTCSDTLPSFLCKHVLVINENNFGNFNFSRIFSLSLLSENERCLQFHNMNKISSKQLQSHPQLPSRSGYKLSDRIGHRMTANNYTRKVNEVSELSVFQSADTSEATMESSSLQNSDESNMDLTNSDDFTPVTLNSRNDESGMNDETEFLKGSNSSITFSPVLSSTLISNRRSHRHKRSIRRFSPSPRSSPFASFNSRSILPIKVDVRLLSFRHSGSTETLGITNTTDSEIYYSCSLSNKKDFSVDPPEGKIGPHKLIEILVTKNQSGNGTGLLDIFYKSQKTDHFSTNPIRTQVYTSHGPPLIAPTWFISRALFDRVGGFRTDVSNGFPEDLDFFYKCLDVDECIFDKVPEDVVMYRYHPECASHSVTEQTIWNFRLKRLKEQYIAKWDKFTIWSAGKQGKRLFKCLDDDEKLKVREFCDIDESKIGRGIHEEFDEKQRIVTHKVPIVNIETAKPPLIVCVKLDLTHGDLERIIERKKWREHVDFVYFG